MRYLLWNQISLGIQSTETSERCITFVLLANRKSFFSTSTSLSIHLNLFSLVQFSLLNNWVFILSANANISSGLQFYISNSVSEVSLFNMLHTHISKSRPTIYWNSIKKKISLWKAKYVNEKLHNTYIERA